MDLLTTILLLTGVTFVFWIGKKIFGRIFHKHEDLTYENDLDFEPTVETKDSYTPSKSRFDLYSSSDRSTLKTPSSSTHFPQTKVCSVCGTRFSGNFCPTCAGAEKMRQERIKRQQEQMRRQQEQMRRQQKRF